MNNSPLLRMKGQLIQVLGICLLLLISSCSKLLQDTTMSSPDGDTSINYWGDCRALGEDGIYAANGKWYVLEDLGIRSKREAEWINSGTYKTVAEGVIKLKGIDGTWRKGTYKRSELWDSFCK